MRTKKKKQAALAAVVRPKAGEVQAGPRAAQAHTLNYLSVTTIDPSRLAAAFAAADQGYLSDQASLYELIEEQDIHVFGEISKRRLAVTSLGFKFMPPKDATQAEIDRTTELEEAVRDIPNFADMHFDITDAIGKGFCAQEMEWQTGDMWLPKAVHYVPQRMFQTNFQTGELELLRNGLGEPLRPFGWVVHRHRAKSGYIESAALFRVLAWTYAYKAYNIADMQKFLELYGLPLRLGKYPAGIGDKQRDELLKAVRNIGNNGAGVIPNTMQIDFVQAVKSGTVDDFLKAVEWWERKQSIAILGGTLTSQADGKTSTNALGTVHNEVRREIMLHDSQQIEPTINQQLVAPIVLINGMFTPDRMPKFTYLTEETADQSVMVDVLGKAAGMGMQIPLEWAHKMMQIPRAGKGEAVLSLGTGGSQAAALSRLVALAKNSAEPDVAGAFWQQLATVCAPFEADLLNQITAAVAEAGDFEGAMAKVAELARSQNQQDAWAKVMAEGLMAGNLAGRLDSEWKNG